MRHTASHVLAQAVLRLYPEAQLGIGPVIADGFYYDFLFPGEFSAADLPRVRKEMRKIIAEDLALESFVLEREEALRSLEGKPFKQELVHDLAADEEIRFYRQGEFVDLCRGPHIPDAGRIKAFKLLSVAGSYWKGDASNRRLQRLYGTAFFSRKEQQAYLARVEEAKKRDHRVLGKKLGLFQISNEVGQGLVLWLPKGATVRSILEDFIKRELLERGYEPVYSPHIGRVELYETSGHFPYYRESQFPPMFGHPAGQLIDRLIHILDSTEPEERPLMLEVDLLKATQALGMDLDENYDTGFES
ncbi:threonine--tRNA ligase, partial [bacterium]|nr:threonine--tRNA ligase [bacterium]